MRRPILLFFSCFILLCVTLKAQKGTNTINVQLEGTVPIYQNDQGFGGFIRGLYGIGGNGQLTISGGVSMFKLKDFAAKTQETTRLVPFLLGYKQNIGHFFIEPQVGLGEMGGKIASAGDYSRPSVAAVFGAVAVGYRINRISAGMRIQTAHGIENSSAGMWHDKNFHYTSLYIGFDAFSKHRN
ncbi:MAG: hypothetical protein JWP81_1236 [Ferruginibacter sp.]|nr:hypothetical protein [Ferruginibacter sp.]